MKVFFRGLLIVLLVLALVAISLGLLSHLIPVLRNEATTLGTAFPESRAWLILAGLLAPLSFVVKKVGEWFAATFLGRGPLSSSAENEIAKRTADLEAELKRIKTEHLALDNERRRELAAERARLALIEQKLDGARRVVANLDEQIEENELRPTSIGPVSHDEIEAMHEELRRGSEFVDVFNRYSTGGGS